ncbi:PadR family transcriptional regulator [Salinibacterium sp. SWN248]|uniref:PadR family transcriptional regulator n=1 Tax=Salinibacterium sp. SWN248 TaxID=2792056 RepID=UPI0018CDDA62|nr:helix-turn-helix transcriptional regulator [Salinibacterium sp. SWN248]MBH0024002.1 PadR family transcriptional regulator [Salinibacterium sp. SWN248]
MSIRHSLLSILAQGPCYGYQLRSEFDRRTGSTWPLNVGQIYNTLDRLVRDGLVTKTSAPVDSGPDATQQTYYTITDAGKIEAEHWLNSPVDSYSVSRDELAIKLAIAVTLPDVDAHTVIEHQRQATRGAIDALSLTVEVREDARDASQFAEQLVTDSLCAHAEAELLWLDRVEATLTTAQSHGLVEAFPLNLTKPKRGRPATTAPTNEAAIA